MYVYMYICMYIYIYIYIYVYDTCEFIKLCVYVFDSSYVNILN